jgi:phosphopantothenoylcysteine decarboxylase/phosphopantothenate--cysteine ligase
MDMVSHPASDLIGLKSNRLSGKKIVLGITGSIAAVETVKLTHELIRHGATVYPVLTEAASKIISPEALKYASGNKPITELTGDIEHVALCGQTKDKADLLLIAPCTANTISKIACGIDDSTVTTFATTAIGSKIPIMIFPAMHGSMYEHPIIQDNIKKLGDRRLNIEVIQPEKVENKWKLASNDEIVARVIRKLWKNDLKSKRVLIIAGATGEPLDDIRILTNKSTGGSGIALANVAYLRGSEVSLWLGRSTIQPPSYLNCKRFDSIDELGRMVSKLSSSRNKTFQIIINCAAISDYKVSKPYTGKLPSKIKNVDLKLVPTPKIIEKIRKKLPKGYLVGYKAEAKTDKKKIIEKAYKRLNDLKLDLIIGNDLAKVTSKTNEILIIHPDKNVVSVNGEKELLAERIFDEILSD